MGLDSVEIVMQWEESLGVTITNEEARILLTPRMAIDLLTTKLGADSRLDGACLTMRAFHRLRSSISSAAGVARSEIHPAARIRDLVPRHDSRAAWQGVRSTSRIASLPNPSWGGLFSTANTMADLARWVVTHAARDLKMPNEPWTRSEIRTVVRRAVTEVVGAERFSDDDQFVRDIGVC